MWGTELGWPVEDGGSLSYWSCLLLCNVCLSVSLASWLQAKRLLVGLVACSHVRLNSIHSRNCLASRFIASSLPGMVVCKMLEGEGGGADYVFKVTILPGGPNLQQPCDGCGSQDLDHCQCPTCTRFPQVGTWRNLGCNANSAATANSSKAQTVTPITCFC